MHVFPQSIRFCRNICTCKAVRRENDVVDGCVTFLSLPSNVARKRLVTSIPWGGEEKAQEEASRSESQLLLYGCEMSRYSHILIGWENSGKTCGIVTWVILFFFLSSLFRLLQDHNGVQPRSDSGAVCGLFNSPVSAHRRQSTSYRGSVSTRSRDC